MKTLKKACQQHYQTQSLSDQQIERLVRLQAQSINDDPVLPAKNSVMSRWVKNTVWRFSAIAASVMVMLALGWVQLSSELPIKDRVAKEIAYNHAKRMGLEVVSSNLHRIEQQLSALDFSLVDSVRSQVTGWQLMGGRYCSIQGKLAAQLRVQKKDSQDYHTYYQAIIPDGLALRQGETYTSWVDGHYIEIWVEGGVLLGLAGDKPR